MTPIRQLFSLFRYQSALMPWIWIFPISFALPGLISYKRFHYSLEILGSTLSQLSWVPLLLAAYVFGTGILAGTRWVGAATIQIANLSSEFILTRAVDKAAVYWSRVLLYWILVLLPVVLWVGVALYKPAFQLVVRPGDLGHYLAALPHSYQIQDANAPKDLIINVPQGNLYKALGQGAASAIIGLVGQVAVLSIAGLRHRQWWYWVLMAGCVVAMGLGGIFRGDLAEDFLLAVIRYWPLVAIGLVMVAIPVLLWGRRRFVEQEQF